MLDKRILENCDLANDDQARLKSAEREQFIEQLFRQNYSEMIHLARVLLGDDGEAEDQTNDFLHLTFLQTASAASSG